MLAPHAFFSFTAVTDPADHVAYNEWHQLDHRPENLALDGVRWGERWVRTPACAGASIADPRLDPTHYVNLYWFRPPVADAVAEWQALAERSFQWGRRQDMTLCTRPLMGFFDVVKGYVAPRVPVSIEALPFRPVHGMLVQVIELAEPHAPRTERLHHWYDAVGIPALLQLPGVAGAYTFASVSSTIDPGFSAAADARTFEASAASSAGSLRIVVVSCDRPPLDVLPAVRDTLDRAGGADARRQADASVVFDSAVETITPWRWDWFDRHG